MYFMRRDIVFNNVTANRSNKNLTEEADFEQAFSLRV